MIRCVAFDFGQVVSSPDNLFTAWADAYHVSADDYEALYWGDRVAYDKGCSDTAYWTPLLASLGLPTTPEMIWDACRRDAQLWVDGVRPEAWQLVQDVRATGTPVAIVSNAPFSLDLALAESDLADGADFWFVSASMGMVKPDPVVYQRVQEVVECDESQIAFIDDRPRNVDAAAALGWTTHLFVDDADTRAWLTGLEVLPRTQE